ncbi:hypothetical protein [Streptomyces anandii]|uniref:hypothetical protein n=1 Tax=Streptomyces anandii TaxID=285454 RepID=UPI0036B06FC9
MGESSEAAASGRRRTQAARSARLARHTSGIPAGQQAEVPTVSEQLSALHHVREPRQLGRRSQVTGLLPPVFGLVPAVR